MKRCLDGGRGDNGRVQTIRFNDIPAGTNFKPPLHRLFYLNRPSIRKLHAPTFHQSPNRTILKTPAVKIPHHQVNSRILTPDHKSQSSIGSLTGLGRHTQSIFYQSPSRTTSQPAGEPHQDGKSYILTSDQKS